MTVRTKTDVDQVIENYGETAKAATTKNKIGKAALVGFGAAAAGGLFTSSQAEADVVYSGMLNVGFNVSTVNASSTNAISPPLVFNSNGGAIAFAIGGNNRGPANPVGSTDILWAVGAGYVGGVGGVFASPNPAFPTTVVPMQYSQTVGSQGTPASLAWAAVGLPANPNVIDPFGAASGTATGFFGFTFSTGQGQTNFGWAQVRITADAIAPTSMTLVDWAYNTDGNRIHVGTVPEPGTAGLMGLAALALGATGIRRRKATLKAA